MLRGLTHALSLTAIVLAGALSSDVANASTINYVFDVTPIFGSSGGTGSLTVDGTSGHDVTALDITIGGVSFDFTGSDLHNASAVIKSGDVVNIKAADITPHGAIVLDFLGGIFLDFAHPRDDTAFALTSIVDPVPLPTTLPMLLIGLAAVSIFTVRARNRDYTPSSAV